MSMTGKTAPNDGWWRGGVIYQIYPRSFVDSNGDGIGDLPGITARLPYVADLGADAIWLAPFFPSPMKDFGYDVSDYRDVDPMFGTLADFKALVDRAHALGLKVIIDQVLSHSSDRHPWFEESRASRDNPRADWYAWADARPDGTPPNNWLSVFGGSAWQWDPRRCQYYLHNFLASQPDLNFHSAAVRHALLDNLRFWLDMGVDGFRLDAVNFCFHDSLLRDNPARGRPADGDRARPAAMPYEWQWHVFDKSRPENLVFLRQLRAVLDEYPHTTSIGEIGCDRSLQRMAEYTGGGDKLHMAYSFELLQAQHDAPYLHGVIREFQAEAGDGWPSWALANHDTTRLASRWGADGRPADPRLLRAAVALQLALRGSPCLYQGDELGLTEAEIGFADLRDPCGITRWPSLPGRDGCRTPMPWAAAPADLGFGDGAKRPWLPPPEAHRALAVDRQAGDAGSLLRHYRRLLHWRRTQPALIHGEQVLWPVHAQVLAFERVHGDQRLLCAFNLSAERAALPWPAPGLRAEPVGGQGAEVRDAALQFEPYGVLFAELG